MAQDRSVTFSTPARIVAGLAGLLLLGLLGVLVAVLMSLQQTRAEIVTTRAKLDQTDQRVQRLSTGFGPVLDAIEPAVSESSQRSIRRTARQLTDATDEIPRVGDEVADTKGIVAAFAGQVEAGDLPVTTAAVRDLARTLAPAGERASTFLSGLDVPGARSASTCDDRLVVRAPSAAGQIGCLLRLVPNLRAVLKAQRRILKRSFLVQQTTRDGVGAGLELFRQSLEVQRELLVRVRSLDDKSGGTAPSAQTP